MENRVECQSEYQYEQRPIMIHWEGQRLVVDTVLAEWRLPRGKGFRVLTSNQSVFELFYDQGLDRWDIRQL